MKKWIDFMTRSIADDLMPRDTYGDWCVPPEEQHLIHSLDPARKTPGEVIGTAYFYYDLRLMARYARLLGKAEDAVAFDALAERLKGAFNRKLFDAASARYANGSQTSSVLPLAFGIVPEEHRDRVFARLVDKIEGESKGHIGTGLIGAQWLMRVLSDGGRPDLAYRIASQRDYPSWGYMVEKGATTIWELWNGDTADPAMNSGNHVMLVGDLLTWLYEYVGGIRPDPQDPAFRHVVIRPTLAGALTWARASHLSPYGTIATSWRLEDGKLLLDVTIPANARATVCVPAADIASVTEGGAPAADAPGVELLRMEGGHAVYAVGSGSYAFASAAPRKE
jgi:alpha-L-rhamnosidase